MTDTEQRLIEAALDYAARIQAGIEEEEDLTPAEDEMRLVRLASDYENEQITLAAHRINGRRA